MVKTLPYLCREHWFDPSKMAVWCVPPTTAPPPPKDKSIVIYQSDNVEFSDCPFIALAKRMASFHSQLPLLVAEVLWGFYSYY